VDVGDRYFLFKDTKDYFPTIQVSENYIPFGDSNSMCINMSWIKKENKRLADKYIQVGGQDECANSNNPKVRWQKNDLKNGMNVKPYL